MRRLVLFFMLLPMTACGAGAMYYSSPSGMDMPMAADEAPGWMLEQSLDQDSRGLLAGDKGQVSPQQVQTRRMVIYTGSFTVDVYDVKEAQRMFLEFVDQAGGHMQSLAANTLVIRIPSSHFTSVEPSLKKIGRVDDGLTRINAQDITEEYQDLELRLRTKKEYLASLKILLDSAGTLKDKLAVQQEIANVLEEIESMEGRRRFLGDQVDLSTVTVTFRLAHSGTKRSFRLPWEWLDEIGLEMILN